MKQRHKKLPFDWKNKLENKDDDTQCLIDVVEFLILEIKEIKTWIESYEKRNAKYVQIEDFVNDLEKMANQIKLKANGGG